MSHVSELRAAETRSHAAGQNTATTMSAIPKGFISLGMLPDNPDGTMEFSFDKLRKAATEKAQALHDNPVHTLVNMEPNDQRDVYWMMHDHSVTRSVVVDKVIDTPEPGPVVGQHEPHDKATH